MACSKKLTRVELPSKFIATQQKLLVKMLYEKCAKNVSLSVSLERIFSGLQQKSSSPDWNR